MVEHVAIANRRKAILRFFLLHKTKLGITYSMSKLHMIQRPVYLCVRVYQLFYAVVLERS
jgi:hypothetical protein